MSLWRPNSKQGPYRRRRLPWISATKPLERENLRISAEKFGSPPPQAGCKGYNGPMEVRAEVPGGPVGREGTVMGPAEASWMSTSTGDEPGRSDSWSIGPIQIWTGALKRWLAGRSTAGGQAPISDVPRARFRNLAISREAGSGAGTIARMVGTRLGWKVYDHELIDGIAQRMEIPVEEARLYDELAPSVLQDWFLPMREEHYAPHEAYLDHLAKLVDAIGQSGRSIIVGRGAGFLLPRDETFSVRIIAPLKIRAQRMADHLGVSLRTARRAARDRDERFLKFARVMYRVHADDPHQYDLVLDSHSLGLPIATEILIRAIEAGLPPVAAGALPNPGDWDESSPGHP